MSETPPPRDPGVPPEDETAIVPASEETVVDEAWVTRPEGQVIVEQTESETVPPRRAPLIWPWLLALLLAVLAGLGAYYYFSQEDEKTVPAVIGMRQERAEAEVREAGLDPEIVREANAKPRGVVLTQNPDPGAKVDEGSDVRLAVSSGPPRETVPDVVGQTESEAIADLTAAGFKADVTKTFSDKKTGTVVSQEPESGTNLKEGSSVALAVSKGGKPVAVPDVVGTTSSEATATLRDAGLKANVVGVPSDQPSGTVIAQNPVAGKQAKAGATIRLNVAQAPGETTTQPPSTTEAPPATTAPAQPATVPDVVGKELAVAARDFAGQGLKVAVQYVPSNEAQGRVIAQAQPAGTERRRGDTVQLNVSIGAEPAAAAAVPDVVGQQQVDGRRALEQAGFEALVLNLNGEVRNESPVASQTPAGGASVPGGSLVILYVGR
jgi:serine/threonine-protein kinase